MKDYKDFYIEAKRDNLPFIFCDMDGVLTDFGKAANKVTGLNWEGLRTNQDWDSIRDTKNFWANMPWKRDGKQLWKYIKKYNPSILSASVQPQQDPNCKPGKLRWLSKNLKLNNSARINLVRRSQKQDYVRVNRGGKIEVAVLIDDYPKNIREWTAKGGIGILHTNTSSTISQLKRLGF